jgi:Antitoxin of toxin-antitoxin, RelE / RelB, TA system
MVTRSACLTTGFTDAKAHFSTLMDEVVHQHRPKVIDRHRGRESMLALPTDDAVEIFLSMAFTPLEVDFDESGVVVTATALSLIGDGPDLKSALGELSAAIEDFAHVYFERFDFYRHTPDRGLAPFLLRFLLTAAEQRAALLLEPLRGGRMDEIAEQGRHVEPAAA